MAWNWKIYYSLILPVWNLNGGISCTDTDNRKHVLYICIFSLVQIQFIQKLESKTHLSFYVNSLFVQHLPFSLSKFHHIKSPFDEF